MMEKMTVFLAIALAAGVAAAAEVTLDATADAEIRGPYGYWADDSNFGDVPNLYPETETASHNDVRRGLMKFDISAVESQVNSATLWFYHYGLWPDGPAAYTFYRGTKDWVELEVTWNSAAAGDPWTNPGGDYDDTLSVVTDVIPSGNVYIGFDVAPLVQAMVDAGQDYGSFQIFSDQEPAGSRLWTKENRGWDWENRMPKLVVDSESAACTPHIGDANEDGEVGIADLSALADNYGATGATWRMGDFNDDGEVGIADLSALADNYGWTGDPCTGQTIPEPMSLALLAAGALIALRRRR